MLNGQEECTQQENEASPKNGKMHYPVIGFRKILLCKKAWERKTLAWVEMGDVPPPYPLFSKSLNVCKSINEDQQSNECEGYIHPAPLIFQKTSDLPFLLLMFARLRLALAVSHGDHRSFLYPPPWRWVHWIFVDRYNKFWILDSYREFKGSRNPYGKEQPGCHFLSG